MIRRRPSPRITQHMHLHHNPTGCSPSCKACALEAKQVQDGLDLIRKIGWNNLMKSRLARRDH